jgi:hypothetical protein
VEQTACPGIFLDYRGKPPDIPIRIILENAEQIKHIL